MVRVRLFREKKLKRHRDRITGSLDWSMQDQEITLIFNHITN